MYSRSLRVPKRSFFLFGPRGTGKSSWVRTSFPAALTFDLLESNAYLELLASPSLLADRVPAGFSGWVVLDEIQRVPELLNEVHRLIELRKLRFVLTGSSARKLRRRGVNLLAGRASTFAMHPLTASELGGDFDLRRSVTRGHLPVAQTESSETSAREYLASYVKTYLREEVQQEGLTRNLAAFSRFLEAASFSQGSLLNVSSVARECQVERKVVEDYFSILEDLLVAVRLPVFQRRAQRALAGHSKFYFFDAGVYRTIRPRGPLDALEDIDGAALETLVLQEIRAHNDHGNLGYDVRYWRTARGEHEVDFVLYGGRGLKAIEVKRSTRVRREDLASLEIFGQDYPSADLRLVYGGTRRFSQGRVEIVPAAAFLKDLGTFL